MLGTQEGSMKSIRPYKTSEQYLYAMKEDLAEWLKDLYGLEIDAESFLDALETGVLLCHHANRVTQLARDLGQEHPRLSHTTRLPKHGVTCNDFAQPSTFQARDNVSNFIRWCRQEMAIQDVLMFETEDLVLRKNEKHFVLCLLEVARQASRFGMQAPTLIQMEEEIDEEIREDLQLPREETPLHKPQRKPAGLKNLDQMVQHFISRCTCPVQFSMIKVSEGKYRVGDSSTLIFVRILRKHVMVRVGGGWDTLEHYLDKHDPCRCTSLSHKQALKMVGPQKSPALLVQHEIAARFTPGKDQPHTAEPAFIVRRSQSPLPLVEWRTYAPHQASMGRRLPPSPRPNQEGTSGSIRKAEGQVSLRDPSDPRTAPSSRVREQSSTPSGRSLAAEEKPGSKQTFLAQGRRGTFCGVFSPQNGSTENLLLGSKSVPELRPGRTGRYLQATVASQNKEAEKVTFPGNAGPKDGGCVASGRLQQESVLRLPTPARSPSPSKNTHASFWQTPGCGSVVHPEGVPADGRRKDPQANRSLSPVKQMGHLQKEDSSLKASGQGGWTSHRPPIPSKSCRGGLVLRNGGSQMPNDKAGPQGKGEAGISFPERARVRFNSLDRRNQRKNIETFLIPENPGKDDQRRQVGTKEASLEKEHVYTPLPIGLAEERGLYRSLEEEIMANIKELEDEEEVNQLNQENQWRGCRTDHPPGRDATVIGWSGQQLSTPSFPFWPNDQRVLDHAGGVPRSGVYIPERETRWHPAGPCYEAVIQELSRTLHREQVPTERPLSMRNCCPESGRPMPKNVPEGAPSHKGKPGSPQAGDGEPPCVTDEGRAGGNLLNGDAPQAPLSTATSCAESLALLEKAERPPRRALKKPERVPSIYKLKLCPRIRPRRDHRPEKGPSKIPTPVAYRRVQRTTDLKRPPKPKSPAKPRARGTLNLRVDDQAERSTTQDEEKAMAEGDAGLTDDEESWV